MNKRGNITKEPMNMKDKKGNAVNNFMLICSMTEMKLRNY